MAEGYFEGNVEMFIGTVKPVLRDHFTGRPPIVLRPFLWVTKCVYKKTQPLPRDHL